MTLQVRMQLARGDFRLAAEFEAPASGVTAVFGPSGAGKTLLLRAMAGLEEAPGGYLRIGDEVWQDAGVVVPTHRRPLGYVFQEPSLFGHLSVGGNLAFAERRCRDLTRKIERAAAVELLGLGALLDRFAESLSGGERQRVAIARAILAGPRLLLMDEPLSALDLAGRAEILPFLEVLHRELEIPIVYVSHAADEVARLADHLVLLERGRVRASGPVAEILTRIDLPPARTDDAAAVIDAVVAGDDPEHGLTYLEFAAGRFTVAATALPAGMPVRLRVLARDVSLTLERQHGTSILNIFPARVEELAELDASLATVRLDLAGVSLLSRITRKSAAALELGPGKSLYVQIKAVALLH